MNLYDNYNIIDEKNDHKRNYNNNNFCLIDESNQTTEISQTLPNNHLWAECLACSCKTSYILTAMRIYSNLYNLPPLGV